MEERTGKTLTSILIAEKCNSATVKNVLVLTKKKALDGWLNTIKACNLKKLYTVVNYEQAHKIKESFDLIILDEAHYGLKKCPRPSETWLVVKPLTKDKPIIYLSATPTSQSFAELFHQLHLSSFSPWRHYKNFYRWFDVYGILTQLKLNGRMVNKYVKTKDDLVQKDIKHLFITKTRSELGFKYEPEDVLHFVELDEKTKQLYRDFENDSFIVLNDVEIVGDTPTKVITKLHQLEGGTIKEDKISFNLDNDEKIRYIESVFGDSEDLVIFYNYKQEELKLKERFKKARVLQSTAFAEGVDLSMYTHLVVYSMNFSTSQYTQRRARQANVNRDKPIKVNFLVVKGAVSHQVYKTVALNKKKFIDTCYEKGLV